MRKHSTEVNQVPLRLVYCDIGQNLPLAISSFEPRRDWMFDMDVQYEIRLTPLLTFSFRYKPVV